MIWDQLGLRFHRFESRSLLDLISRFLGSFVLLIPYLLAGCSRVYVHACFGMNVKKKALTGHVRDGSEGTIARAVSPFPISGFPPRDLMPCKEALSCRRCQSASAPKAPALPSSFLLTYSTPSAFIFGPFSRQWNSISLYPYCSRVSPT